MRRARQHGCYSALMPASVAAQRWSPSSPCTTQGSLPVIAICTGDVIWLPSMPNTVPPRICWALRSTITSMGRRDESMPSPRAKPCTLLRDMEFAPAPADRRTHVFHRSRLYRTRREWSTVPTAIYGKSGVGHRFGSWMTFALGPAESLGARDSAAEGLGTDGVLQGNSDEMMTMALGRRCRKCLA